MRGAQGNSALQHLAMVRCKIHLSAHGAQNLKI
jgi:hypothetical protein